MSIPAIDPTFVAMAFPSLGGTSSAASSAAGSTAASGAASALGSTHSAGATDPTAGADFNSMVMDGLDRLQGLQSTSSDLAVKAASGDLDALHDYTVAATEASVATQLTVSLRNQAVGAFNEIMRLQV